MNIIQSIEEAQSAIQSIAKAALTQSIESRGSAVLALSGGSTPKLYLPDVFSLELPWDKVTLVLADERWVPPTDPDSNEKLIEDLRRNTPAQAAFLLSLWSYGSSPEEAAGKSRELALARRLSITLAFLGMGEDGHIASLFPGDSNLETAREYWVPVDAPAPPNVPLPRLSLSPRTLLASGQVVLAFSGKAKYDVWHSAWHNTQTSNDAPVSLLKQHPFLTTFFISE